jgi:hypothetical protein
MTLSILSFAITSFPSVEHDQCYRSREEECDATTKHDEWEDADFNFAIALRELNEPDAHGDKNEDDVRGHASSDGRFAKNQSISFID